MTKSGVTCTDEVVNAFAEQKNKRSHRYNLYKISDDKKTIELDSQGDCEWPEFAEVVPRTECRYATFDFRYDQGGPKEKLIFVAWCPDEAPIKQKMLYASSKDAIQKKLDGVQVIHQANCTGDLAYSDIFEKVSKSKAN